MNNSDHFITCDTFTVMLRSLMHEEVRLKTDELVHCISHLGIKASTKTIATYGIAPCEQ